MDGLDQSGDRKSAEQPTNGEGGKHTGKHVWVAAGLAVLGAGAIAGIALGNGPIGGFRRRGRSLSPAAVLES